MKPTVLIRRRAPLGKKRSAVSGQAFQDMVSTLMNVEVHATVQSCGHAWFVNSVKPLTCTSRPIAAAVGTAIGNLRVRFWPAPIHANLAFRDSTLNRS